MYKGMIFRIILILIGGILFAWFFLPAVFTRNFHIGVITGSLLFACVFLYGAFMPRVNLFIKCAWNKTLGKGTLCAAAAVCFVILSLALSSMAAICSKMFANGQSGQTAIVLGCRIYASGPSLMLKARLDAAYDYLEENPDSICILCGGQGENEPTSEALAMKNYLLDKGVSEERMILDTESTSTEENLKNAALIIAASSQALRNNVTVITNNYHMYRALKYARQVFGAEANISGQAAQTPWWLFPAHFVREMYGVVWMWVSNLC